MPFLSLDDFRQIVLIRTPEEVVKEYVFGGEPFVFRGQSEKADIISHHLSTTLGILPENLTIVGSAKVGFSLNPVSFPRQFSDESDIDVIVVDAALFDGIWMTLLNRYFPHKRLAPVGVEGTWEKDRRRDVFLGRFIPDEIRYDDGWSLSNTLRTLNELSTRWFNAFRALSLFEELADRNVSGRLYRTWDHAMRYHADGIRQIRDSIQKSQPRRTEAS